MKIIIAKDYDTMSEKAFEIMRKVVICNKNAVLGLATGTTPLGLYREMIKDHKENGTSYSEIKTVNLDEYVGLDITNSQSYAYFMRENLFRHIDIKAENTFIENGKAIDKQKECERYDGLLAELKQDIQLLGIGSNGHIAFNEPNTSFSSTTHIVNLTENTINDNSRLFKSINDVPHQAFTMGIKNIMNAKKILILASGENKSNAVYQMIYGDVNEKVPATILRTHPDCTLIVDEDAAKKI